MIDKMYLSEVDSEAGMYFRLLLVTVIWAFPSITATPVNTNGISLEVAINEYEKALQNAEVFAKSLETNITESTPTSSGDGRLQKLFRLKKEFDKELEYMVQTDHDNRQRALHVLEDQREILDRIMSSGNKLESESNIILDPFLVEAKKSNINILEKKFIEDELARTNRLVTVTNFEKSKAESILKGTKDFETSPFGRS